MIHPRTHLNRATAPIAVAIIVLSLVLSGSGVTAQTPGEKQYGPATPEEIQALEAAEENTGVPDAAIFENGYPGSSIPEAPDVAAAQAIDAWSANWAVGRLCGGAEQCLVGDFNGDNKDDVAVLYRDTRAEPQAGDVMVATSKGLGFNAAVKWAENMCRGGQVCKVGDFNADGRDDIVIFNHGPESQAASGSANVFVSLSTGTSFQTPILWHSLFCVDRQVCEVGNFDGINGDDIVLFRRSTDPQPAFGDVEIARSNGVNGFGAAEKWHDFFCIENEECRVADMNGDRLDDIVAFVKSTGRVAVATSTRFNFGTPSDWASGFCTGDQQCELGDFEGNGLDDALKFLRTGSGGATFGDVEVRLSNGTALTEPQRWHDNFCFPGDDCSVGDFNGDNRMDVIRFVKQNMEPSLVGAAYVALAGGTPYGFVKTPPPDGKWLENFCRGGQTCTTGDFNGDGLTDIIYFVRDTQGEPARGDVYVSLNQNGVQFGFPQKWQEFSCVGQDICKVGDVDGDGDDDLIVFSRVQNGYVYVNRSTGSSFDAGSIWNTLFCISAEVCDVGDFNGDSLADIILFTRSAYGINDRAGDVEVALSTGSSFVNTGSLWHRFFCIGTETCQVGDFNGDGKDDIVAFAKGSSAKVFVELSLGYQFGNREAPAETWQEFFCAGNEVCDVGDVNGDGRDDVIAFLQLGYDALTRGDVYVGLSKGAALPAGFEAQKWNDFFCIEGELCDTGFFNRDNRKDIVTFARASGVVFVALANAGTGYHFSNAIPIPADARRNYLPMIWR